MMENVKLVAPEPANSWEVSYIFKIYRPNTDIGVTFDKIVRTIGTGRAKELDSIPRNFFDSIWFRDHK